MATSLAHDAVTERTATAAQTSTAATPLHAEVMSSNAAAVQLNNLETSTLQNTKETEPIPLEENIPSNSRRLDGQRLGPTRTDTITAMNQATVLDTENVPPLPTVPMSLRPPDETQAQRPSITHTPTIGPAIGPSTDTPAPAHLLRDPEVHGPTLMINLLLTNGSRHPFKLDGTYLTKCGVVVKDDNPFELSVYQLKQLILREWRSEWEVKPSSPGAIRLIMLGKLLEDKAIVKDLRFNRDAANVVHMTVKPQDFMEDEAEGKSGKAAHMDRSGRDRDERTPRCRCVIM